MGPPGYPRDKPVPHEAVYHFELYRVLTSWLSPSVATQIELNAAMGVEEEATTSEKRSDSRRRCDMKLEAAEETILIEIVANETQAVINKHFLTAEVYGHALQAEEVWVVIFTVAERSQFQLVWPSRASRVQALYVFHAPDWAHKDIVLRPSEEDKQRKITKNAPARKRKRSKKEDSKKKADKKRRAVDETTKDGKGSTADSKKIKEDEEEGTAVRKRKRSKKGP